MISIHYQDSDIIILDYTWNGLVDGIYFKIFDPRWMESAIGDDYRVMINRSDMNLIQIGNEYYESKYQAIETSLIGDVLILGSGLITLDQFLTTGSSWKWVERNAWLVANHPPTNGTIHLGDAEDEVFLATLGTFDTILIDFKRTKLVDYDSLLNMGGSIIEMTI